MTAGSVTFENLQTAKQEIAELCGYHLSSLGLFHLTRTTLDIRTRPLSVAGFVNLIDESKRDVSIASTATCIRSLFSHPSFRSRKGIDFSSLHDELERHRNDGKILTGGLEPLNPFTVGLLLPILKDIGFDRHSQLVEECIQAARADLSLVTGGATLASSAGGVRIGRYPANGYLTYWCMRGLAEWGEGIDWPIETSFEWSRLELLRQISLFAANDEESDAFQLGYNLLIQHRFSSTEDWIHHSTIRLGLSTLFDAQLERGVWEKKDPIFVFGSFGDAYCFSFELLSTLLHDFQSQTALLLPHEDHLARAMQWAVRSAKWVNDASGLDVVPVWRSGNRADTESAESWATAEVFSFLQYYRGYVSGRLQGVVQRSFRGSPRSKPVPDALASLYFPDVKLPQEKDPTNPDEKRVESLIKLLMDRLVTPLALSDGVYSLSYQDDRDQRVRSGMLFGPPGTGKTSIAKTLARQLGWPLVVLDPGDFAREGLSLIPSVTSRMFEQLREMEDTVIFFDEMEELIRERGGEEGGTYEQKFFTTSLLPKLQDLHDRARCVFLVATNHYAAIDKAAKRAGRFDFKVQVLPPSYEEKVRMLGERETATIVSQLVDELELSNQSRHKVAWATWSEWLGIISQVKRAGTGTVRQIFEAFEPSLLEGDDADKVKTEWNYNEFNEFAV